MTMQSIPTDASTVRRGRIGPGVLPLTLFILVGACWGKAMAVPEVWKVADGGNGHSYEAVSASVSWSEANVAANAAGGYLATIQSADENQFVFDLVDADMYWNAFNSGYFWGPWLGGRQRASAVEPMGGWEWVTGEPFEYTNWRAGEPNNQISAGFQENALHFFAVPSGTRAPTWNDFFDHSSLRLNGYIIEYVPEPSAFLLLLIGGLVLSGVLSGRRTWV